MKPARLAALLAALAGGAGVVSVAISADAPWRLPSGVCARAPTDGGVCFSGSHQLAPGNTYGRGVVHGQCDFFTCPVQP